MRGYAAATPRISIEVLTTAGQPKNIVGVPERPTVRSEGTDIDVPTLIFDAPIDAPGQPGVSMWRCAANAPPVGLYYNLVFTLDSQMQESIPLFFLPNVPKQSFRLPYLAPVPPKVSSLELAEQRGFATTENALNLYFVGRRVYHELPGTQVHQAAGLHALSDWFSGSYNLAVSRDVDIFAVDQELIGEIDRQRNENPEKFTSKLWGSNLSLYKQYYLTLPSGKAR